MKKIIFYGLLIFVLSIGIGYYYSSLWKKENGTVFFYDNTSKEEIATETSSNDEKLSYNASFAIKKKYLGCGHFTFKYSELPKELVNLSKSEIEKMYPDWKVENYSNNNIVLSQDVEGFCDDHYVLRMGEDNIEIFKQIDKNEMKYYKSTDISKDYLTVSDLKKLKDGIFIFGVKNLNSTLEDFE